jgi:hypothetical protein
MKSISEVIIYHIEHFKHHRNLIWLGPAVGDGCWKFVSQDVACHQDYGVIQSISAVVTLGWLFSVYNSINIILYIGRICIATQCTALDLFFLQEVGRLSCRGNHNIIKSVSQGYVIDTLSCWNLSAKFPYITSSIMEITCRGKGG